MSIRHIASAAALVALVAASPAFAQDKPADQTQANTITDEYGNKITDEYGSTLQRDPAMVDRTKPNQE